MAKPDRSAVTNHLLAHMDDDDFGRVMAGSERVQLPRMFALATPDRIADYCYFIESGIASIILALGDGGRRGEIAIVGREGMVPVALALNAPSAPYSIFMQVAGDGYRIQSSVLASLLTESVALRNLLSRYAQTMLVQTSFTALVNATQRIEQRLARWILMCHDRVDTDTIALTHEFLGIMLAVRRQSITTAIPVLEGNGLIKADRNRITVLNREGLQVFAGKAYGQPEAEYRRLLGF